MTPEEKIAEKIFRSIDAGAYSEYQVGDNKDINMITEQLRIYSESREQAAAKEMREKCAEQVRLSFKKQNTYEVDRDGVQEDIMELTLPTHSFNRAVLEARLEEAKWWDKRDTAYETDAVDKSQRIAELESELQKLN